MVLQSVTEERQWHQGMQRVAGLQLIAEDRQQPHEDTRSLIDFSCRSHRQWQAFGVAIHKLQYRFDLSSLTLQVCWVLQGTRWKLVTSLLPLLFCHACHCCMDASLINLCMHWHRHCGGPITIIVVVIIMRCFCHMRQGASADKLQVKAAKSYPLLVSPDPSKEVVQ
jgi:hypothetical protein